MTQELVHYGIGASQAGAAAGLNPWTAPIQLYQEIVEGFRRPETPAMRWGKLLEPVMRQVYADEFGASLFVPPTSMFHPKDAWKRVTPDGLVLRAETDRHPGIVIRHETIERGVELKTAGSHSAHDWGPSGTDEVPIQYIAQAGWSMHVLNVPVWDVAVLIGGNDARFYRLRRDLEFEADLVAAVTEFWERCQRRDPPPPDDTDAYRSYLTEKYTTTTGTIRLATEAEEALVEKLATLRRELRAAERVEKALANELLAALGEDDGLEGSFGRVSARSQIKRTVEWAAVAGAVAAIAGIPPEQAAATIENLAKEYTKETRFRAIHLPRESKEG